MSTTTTSTTSSASLKSLLGLLLLLLASTTTVTTVNAFDYNVTTGDDTVIFLRDAKTGIENLKTIFTDDVTLVEVRDVVWEPSGVVEVGGGNDFLTYQTLVNGELQAEGLINLTGVGRQLPTELAVGNVTIPKSTFSVMLLLLLSSLSWKREKRHSSSCVELSPSHPFFTFLIFLFFRNTHYRRNRYH